ncbi:MAG: Gfo/Idh/MocA family oxidoreductase [Deltaproteobacteria bacterium]|nr:Gfo/Idh/MocA family oxidoreductase [Deltaproteobacteria bacterium]
MEEKVGVALIGCGYWGINYLRVFNELPQSHAVVVCDARQERLQEIHRRFPDIQCTTDIDTALQTKGVTAAVICTPATTHYAVAQRCIAARKHILVEKPITTEVSDAEELITLAQRHRLQLMVGHIFLFNPAIEKVKEYITRGDVGKVYYLYARRTNMGPIRQDVNALWDLAPHDVSIFNYLLDATPSWVSAVGARVLGNQREDVGFISLGYKADTVCHIHVSWADADKVREVVVVGSNKRVVFNDFNPLERVRVFDKGVSLIEPETATFGEYQLQVRDGDIISPRVDVSEPLKNQCAHFIECIQTGRSPRTDAWAGRDVVRVMTAIDRSLRDYGTPVVVQEEEKFDVRSDSFTASALR